MRHPILSASIRMTTALAKLAIRTALQERADAQASRKQAPGKPSR